MAKSDILRSKLINGVAPAMATPLMEDGYRVNTAVVPQLVEFLIGAGAKGLFVGGTTGEGILLETAERKRLHEAAIKAAAGRVPVFLHAGANRMDAAMELAEHAAQSGADAVAAVTPFYYGLDEDGLLAYYKAIAEAAGETPLFLYDIPHMAVNGISPGLLRRLAVEIPTLSGMKSSRRDAQEVRQLMAAAPDGFIVLAGNESVALGLLALGADGLISGLSTAVPEPFVALTRSFGEGDLASARRWQRLINRLLAAVPAGRRIGAIKHILGERGIEAGPAVPPRNMPTEPLWPRLETLLGETA